jgi:hypothetical protein
MATKPTMNTSPKTSSMKLATLIFRHTTRQKMNGLDFGGVGFCDRSKIHYRSQARDAFLRQQTDQRSLGGPAFLARGTLGSSWPALVGSLSGADDRRAQASSLWR